MCSIPSPPKEKESRAGDRRLIAFDVLLSLLLLLRSVPGASVRDHGRGVVRGQGVRLGRGRRAPRAARQGIDRPEHTRHRQCNQPTEGYCLADGGCEAGSGLVVHERVCHRCHAVMVCRCEQVPKRKEGALAKPATPVAASKPSGEGAVPSHTSAARLYLNLYASYAFVY